MYREPALPAEGDVTFAASAGPIRAVVQLATPMSKHSTVSLLAVLLCTMLIVRDAAAATVVAQQGNASITHDAATATWTLSAAGASLILAAGASRDFSIVQLLSPSGATWVTAGDSLVRIANRSLPFGSRAAGFAFQDAAVV